MTKEELVHGFRASFEAALSNKTPPKDLAVFLAQFAGLDELTAHINLIEPDDVREILGSGPLCTAEGQAYLVEVKAAFKDILYKRVS